MLLLVCIVYLLKDQISTIIWKYYHWQEQKMEEQRLEKLLQYQVDEGNSKLCEDIYYKRTAQNRDYRKI